MPDIAGILFDSQSTSFGHSLPDHSPSGVRAYGLESAPARTPLKPSDETA
jgi:hypothetical protein